MAGLRRARPGVTLMELLVVLGVFSVTVMLTSSIFLQANAVQRRVLLLSAAQADLRFALEAVVREVRMSGVDYAVYLAAGGGVEIPSDRLIVRNPFGQRETFFLSRDPSVCPAGSPSCLAVSVDDGPAESMTSAAVAVDRLHFFISPSVDPFSVDASGSYPADRQPTVTMVIEARTLGAKPQDVVTLNAQTTVTARTYVR